MRWTCYLTKNREKPYRWLQAPYQKCTAKFLWTSLPSFSKSTQREHSIITVEKKGYPLINPKHYCPCQTTAFLKPQSWTKEDAFFRRSSQRAHSNIIVIYSIVALVKTLGSMFLTWRLGYSNILFERWPFPDIPNEGNWWVRDSLLPSFSEKRGLLGFKLFCLLTACSLLKPRGF